jgi:hypothetical protein
VNIRTGLPAECGPVFSILSLNVPNRSHYDMLYSATEMIFHSPFPSRVAGWDLRRVGGLGIRSYDDHGAAGMLLQGLSHGTPGP